MRVLITGGKGMLAQYLAQAFSKGGCTLCVLSRGDLDITDLELFLKRANNFKPDLILNAAAFTAVDENELFPERAFRVNAMGAQNAALVAREQKARLVHFSTDYVFDGAQNRAYREDDRPAPLSVYGKSKLSGEKLVRKTHNMHFIVRTSWLFGEHGKNFVRTIYIKLLGQKAIHVVSDQRGSPTYCKDLAAAVMTLAKTSAYGTYHLSNSGCCSRFELAREIARYCGFRDDLILPARSTELNLPASRPANSTLDNYRWKLSGFETLRDYRPALIEYLHYLQFQDKISGG
jgi:dTDP-4-dehydrorhamnose reductase